MKIFIASDHAGFELKSKLIEAYRQRVAFDDLGTSSTESCDYPIFARQLCKRLLSTPGSLGILICGTGIGMSIAANKIHGIRAASVSEAQSAQMSREHNDTNVLCLGARILDEDEARQCVDAFLNAKFDSTHPRHRRRVEQMTTFETEECQ